MEELNYHVDFGQFYVHLTRKQKKYLAVKSVVDRILATLALIVLSPLFLMVSIAQKISAPDEPIFFLQKRTVHTIPISISIFYQTYGAKWHLMAAAAIIGMIPALIVFLLFQKSFIKGLSSGGIKG